MGMLLLRNFILGCLWLVTITVTAQSESFAVYYGDHVPVNQLKLFDTVVVDPDHLPSPPSSKESPTNWYAYVSIGEVNETRSYFKQLNAQWILEKNTTWNSRVMDAANPDWRNFVVDSIISPLWAKGYKHFFFDTMDSYQLVAKTDAKRHAQEQGLILLIHAVKTKYPGATIILNRGFELLPKVQKDVAGFAAESLYNGYNATKKQYQEVSESNRAWLSTKLNEIKKAGLKAYVIDYLPLEQQDKATQLAEKISSDGFVPYVGMANLDSLGASTFELIPREVIMLYSSSEEEEKILSSPSVYLSMPLNYLGYAPHIYDINQALPSYPLIRRVAGIAIWLSSSHPHSVTPLIPWVTQALEQHIPVVFFSNIDPFLEDKALAQKLGLAQKEADESNGFRWSIKNEKLIGFEAQPYLDASTFSPLRASNADILLQMKNSSGQSADLVAITSWGGYALSGAIVRGQPDNTSRYIINPFDFLERALKLQPIPIPDVTTENGRRILIAHVDGDGFYSRSEWPSGPYAGETLLRTILDKFQIPTAISIIEGEIGPEGLKPKESRQLMQIARNIYALPWVEIANHSFSHPFNWHEAIAHPRMVASDPYSKDRLPIPDYTFSLKREIIDTTRFINEQLAPKGKLCRIFLWTGDGVPGEEALSMVYQLGLLNMNGGNTTISKMNNSLTAVSSMGIYDGPNLQILAPIQNENIYTNLWHGPFYGYKRVIETFQMTDTPRRLKPIDIYYHFYSASKVASLKVLDEVYEWALKQPVNPQFASAYIEKVMDYYDLAIAKKNNQFRVCGTGAVTTFRSPNTFGYPQITNDVIGYNDINDSHYIHTNKQLCREIAFQSSQPSVLYLHDSNAQLIHFDSKDGVYYWKMKAEIPLILQFANAAACQFTLDGKAVASKEVDRLWTITSDKKGTYEVRASCSL